MRAVVAWKSVGDGEWVGTDVSERFPVYTRGNAGEVYPEVYRPLSFSIAAEAGEQAMRNAVIGTGIVRPEEIADVPLTTSVFTGVFGGYAYLNLSAQRLVSERMPGGSAADADTTWLGAGEEAPAYRRRPGDRNLRASVGGLRYAVRLLWTKELPRLAEDQRRVDQYLASLPDVETATDDELRRSAASELIDLFMELFEHHLVISGAAGGMMSLLTQQCERHFDDGARAVRLVAGLGEVDSAAPSEALWRLGRLVAASNDLTAEFDRGVEGLWDRLRPEEQHAAFVSLFDDFLAEHGARGPNEWDSAFDTWETDPSLALALVDRIRLADEDHDPERQVRRLAAEREQLERESLDELGRFARPLFRRVLAAARLYGRARERSKTTVVRAIHGSRLRVQELDRRLVVRSGGERGDLWFLVNEEVDGYVADPASFADVIAERRRMHEELARRIPPFTFEGEMPPLEEWELRNAPRDAVEAGDTLVGLPGCAGVARGRARIVTDPGDPRGLAPGDVLIAPLTDPSWTPLFVPAEAVVVDVGAVMSHAVIVSRELGIPCAVSVSDATRRIPDGSLVEVDGGFGTVTILELPG